jgi:hypothetical protein
VSGRGYAGGYYRGGAGGYYRGGYGGYRGGYSTGAYWRGGYWRGGFWPRAYYGPGFSWFLAALPLAYATYWYAGIPYYYANDVYYTWSPDYSGYVATDPPPVADSSGAAPDVAPPADAPPSADALGYPGGANAAPGQAYPASGEAYPAPATAGPAAAPPLAGAGAGVPLPDPRPSQEPRMFMYPTKGQTEDQQRSDKLACEKWASDQVGLGTNGPDYQRALAACIQGRGYSVN